MLKSILNLEGVVVLSKMQQKSIKGALNNNNLVKCPQDDCSSDKNCPSSSYCANTTCKNPDGTYSSFNSCQWR